MKISKIRYNPRLSPEQNAKKNGVSVSAIRYYIKTQGIDRRYDKKIAIIESARKYLKDHPGATKTEVAKGTKHSLTTIREYWLYISTEEELPVFDSNKTKNYQLRQLNNFYATHPSVLFDLLRVEDFNHKILEPFSGAGTISRALEDRGYEVLSYDIVDRGYGNVGGFLETEFEEGVYDIITNPPYDNKCFCDFVLKCIRICKNKVALVLPLRYLSSQSRYNEIYHLFPPARVYVYTDRICIAKNADFEKYNDRGANLEIYAWLVWDKQYHGEPLLRWLMNDMKEVLK